MEGKQHKKRNITLLIVLQGLVVLTIGAQIYHRNYYNVFLCVLTLALFNIPKIVDKRFNVKLPTVLECTILLFIYAAEIMGEIQSFYTIIPYWDTLLHTLNGFIMAAIGFAMIDILNDDPRVHMNMSPYFVAFVAFCFSMTIGVMWEFFEFGMDALFRQDMQKDAIVSSFSSVLINPSGLNDTVRITDVAKTVIEYGNGQKYVVDGYLDIGIIDTMKDLLVNLLGAAVFSVIGMFYIKQRGKGRIARSLIPQMKTEEEIKTCDK